MVLTSMATSFRRGPLAAVLAHPAARTASSEEQRERLELSTWLRRRSAFARSSLTNPHVLQPSQQQDARRRWMEVCKSLLMDMMTPHEGRADGGRHACVQFVVMPA